MCSRLWTVVVFLMVDVHHRERYGKILIVLCPTILYLQAAVAILGVTTSMKTQQLTSVQALHKARSLLDASPAGNIVSHCYDACLQCIEVGISSCGRD